MEWGLHVSDMVVLGRAGLSNICEMVFVGWCRVGVVYVYILIICHFLYIFLKLYNN